MAEESKKISFGFAKSIKKTVLKNVPLQEEKKVDYIECLDEKAIKVIGEEEKKEEPLVIPLLGSRTWHDRIVNKIDADVFEPKAKSGEKENSEVQVKIEPDAQISNGTVTPDSKDSDVVQVKIEKPDEEEKPITLEEQAAKEILEDLQSGDKKSDEEKAVLTLPVPESQSMRGQAESTLEDYEKIPVDAFGFAMLRGMGWQPGKGIGKNEKVVEAVIPELRPKGMGLGADKITLQKQAQNANNKQEEELKIEKGTYVKLVAGKQCNNYGQIEGFDDDAGRLIVKMALSGNIISVNEFMVQPVTPSEYLKNSKVLNATKYEEYKNKEINSKNKKASSEDAEASSSNGEDHKEKSHRKQTEENKRSKKPEERKKSSHASESDSEHEKKIRKRRSSDSDDDAYKSKKSKKSKKHRREDSSPERSSRKHKKKDKERERTKDRRSRRSESLDRRKHKKRRRSRSRDRL